MTTHYISSLAPPSRRKKPSPAGAAPWPGRLRRGDTQNDEVGPRNCVLATSGDRPGELELYSPLCRAKATHRTAWRWHADSRSARAGSGAGSRCAVRLALQAHPARCGGSTGRSTGRRARPSRADGLARAPCYAHPNRPTSPSSPLPPRPSWRQRPPLRPPATLAVEAVPTPEPRRLGDKDLLVTTQALDEAARTRLENVPTATRRRFLPRKAHAPTDILDPAPPASERAHAPNARVSSRKAPGPRGDLSHAGTSRSTSMRSGHCAVLSACRC